MSDANPLPFSQFAPGFDFLRHLAASGQGAAGPLAALHPWFAPTVSVEELDKRIAELKAALFWIEQNGTALKAAIQALEVQKMTLSALQGMNLGMAEIARAFTVPTQDAAGAAPPPAAGSAAEGSSPRPWPYAGVPAPTPEAAADTLGADGAAPTGAETAAAAPTAGMVDPAQWWSALAQQFQQIAAHTLRDAAPPANKAARTAAAKKAPAKKPRAKKTGAPASAKQTRPAVKKPAPAPARPGASGWPPPSKPGR